MLTCCNCQYHWTFQETVTSLCSAKLICPSCHKEQYISANSRFKTCFVTCLTLFLQFYFYKFQIDSSVIFIVNALICLIVIMVLPSFYELSMEEERMR